MRARRIAIDLDSILNLDDSDVADIWYGQEGPDQLHYGDWGPMVFDRLEPRVGALGWAVTELRNKAEILWWSTTLPDEAPIVLRTEDWLGRWLNRPGVALHMVKGRLDFIEAQVYLHAGKDLAGLGVAPNYRQLDVGVTGPWPTEAVELLMDLSTTPEPPADHLTEPDANEHGNEEPGKDLPKGAKK